MYEILFKQVLNPVTKMMVVDAPEIAKVCKPGQFVMIRVNETGERFPLTIGDFDREKGTITIVFQEVGKSTLLLGSLEKGDKILDFVGPLGKPSPTEKKYGTVVAIGGGCGSAIVFPVARAFKEAGNYLITINGARSMDLLLYRDEMLVLDMEAGVEHLGRATAQAVDALLVVLEPGRRSLQTAARVREMAGDIGVTRVFAIGNKVRGESDLEFLKANSAVPVIGHLSANPELTEADMKGLGVFDAAPRAVEEARAIVAALEAQ